MPDQDIYLPQMARDRERLARLLRSLLLSPEDAEDAAQEAFLRARQTKKSTATFGWFVRAAKHAFLDQNRAARRRVHREHAHAAREALPSTVDIAAEAELRARVHAAIQSLEKHHRDVLLDRYFGDLRVADIARRDSLPVNTVKSRIVRARAALLERLERDGLGREAHWSVAAASLLAPGSDLPRHAQAAGVAPSAGVRSGVVTWKAGAFLAVLAATGSSLFLLGPSSLRNLSSLRSPGSLNTPEQEGPDSRAQEVRPSPKNDARPESVGVTATISQDGRVAAGAKAPEAKGIHESTASETVVISATISTTDGAPIEGAELCVTSLQAKPHAISDGAGEASVSVRIEDLVALQPQAVFVRVRARGFASVQRSIGQRSADGYFIGHIQLAPGGAIKGQVLNAQGEPQRSASVGWFHPPAAEHRDPDRHVFNRPRRLRSEVVTTDTDGRYHLEGVPLGLVAVCAWADQTQYTVSAAHELTRHVPLDMPPLQLRPAPRANWIAGRVLDASGEPRRSEPVFLMSADGHKKLGETKTDSLGAFSFVTGLEGLRNLRAGLVGHGPLYAYDVSPGTVDLTLRPKEVGTFTVTARTSNGEPLKSFFVSCELASGANMRGSDGSSDQGLPLELPLPQGKFLVDVYSPPFPTVWGLGPFDPGTTDLVVEAVFGPFQGLTGVVRLDGKLAGNVHVEAHGIRARARANLLENGLYKYDSPGQLSYGTSDATGEFRLPIDHRQAFSNGFQALELRAALPGQVPQRALRIDLKQLARVPSENLEPVEITIVAPGTLKGRVVTPAGTDLRGWVVAIANGDGQTQTQMISEGSTAFQFEGLSPGGWQVVAGPRSDLLEAVGLGQRGSIPIESIPWSVIISSGRTTEYDVHVRETAPK